MECRCMIARSVSSQPVSGVARCPMYTRYAHEQRGRLAGGPTVQPMQRMSAHARALEPPIGSLLPSPSPSRGAHQFTGPVQHTPGQYALVERPRQHKPHHAHTLFCVLRNDPSRQGRATPGTQHTSCARRHTRRRRRVHRPGSGCRPAASRAQSTCHLTEAGPIRACR